MPANCIAGYIMSQSIGPAETKKLSCYQLNIIDGTINLYAKLLNSQEQLDKIKECNELATGFAEVTEEFVK
eukprot:9657548-Ditylum_brightwellii.AAC.1